MSTDLFPNRALSVFWLERTLIKYLQDLLSGLRLDNPEVNELQPDQVPYDFKARSESLIGKVPPKVYRAQIPRTVTGVVDVARLPNVPAVILQAVSGTVATEPDSSNATVRILCNVYDENPEGTGGEDLLNLTEKIFLNLGSDGQDVIDRTAAIVMPITWLISEETFPHWVSEITTNWELPPLAPRSIVSPYHLEPPIKTEWPSVSPVEVLPVTHD